MTPPNILRQSPVTFDRAAHVYTLDGKELHGVTGIVKWVYPDTYTDVPEGVLRAAAEHGSLIHAACELWDTAHIKGGISETDDYAALEQEHGLVPIANEYLVDDGADIASCIDVVYRGAAANTVVIADIKTTSRIYTEHVALQLSIYAWLFEKQNRHLEVEDVAVIWLPRARYGRSGYRTLQRIPSEVCRTLAGDYIRGGDGRAWAARLGDNNKR